MSGTTLQTFAGALKRNYHPKLRREAIKKKINELAKKQKRGKYASYSEEG